MEKMSAERFQNAVVEIEQLLRSESSDDRGEWIDLKTLIDNSKVLSYEQKRKMHIWRGLRNAIVHNIKKESKFIADPRPSEVTEIERLVEILRNPPKVSQVLELTPPVVLSWDSEVSDFFSELMPPKDFSQAPYVDEAGFYKLITSNAVARWAASSYEVKSGALIESARIVDVAGYSEDGDKLACKRHDLTAQSAIEILTDPSGIPPAAILLTDTGHENGKAMGLVVKADLPSLFKATSL
jgi:hypothetical protein